MGGGGRRGEHNAGEFGAGDPGEGRLMLIFATDLEQVEEVGGAGANADEVLVWGGGWVGDGSYGEVSWALFIRKCSVGVEVLGQVGNVYLDVCFYLDGLHLDWRARHYTTERQWEEEIGGEIEMLYVNARKIHLPWVEV